VAEGVVDPFEPVEVDEVHRDGTAGACRAGERLLEPVEEQRAVRQPGQRIVQRPVGQPVLGLLEVAVDLAQLRQPVGQFRVETKVAFCECVEIGGKGPDLQGTLILASARTRLSAVLTGHRVIQLSNRPAHGACGPVPQD